MSLAIIGLGHELRGDDAAGLSVVRLIAERRPDLAPRAVRGEGLELLELMAGAHGVILVDAIRSGHAPGSVFRFNASAGDLPWALFGRSTHSLGVGEVLALARSLGRLPERVLLYGIEGARYGVGEGLSVAVAAAVPGVADRVIAEAHLLTGEPGAVIDHPPPEPCPSPPPAGAPSPPGEPSSAGRRPG